MNDMERLHSAAEMCAAWLHVLSGQATASSAARQEQIKP